MSDRSPEQQQLLSVVELGIEAEAFQQSELGKTLLLMAQIQAEEAARELKTADPEEPKMIRELQNRIWRAENFRGFLDEIVNDGRQASDVLRLPSE